MSLILKYQSSFEEVLRQPQGVAFVLGVLATMVAEIRAQREQPEAKGILRLDPDEVFLLRRWSDLISKEKSVRERAHDVFNSLSLPYGQYEVWPRDWEYDEVSEESMGFVIDAFDEMLQAFLRNGDDPSEALEWMGMLIKADMMEQSGVGCYMLATFHLDLMLRMLCPRSEILDPFAFTGGTFVRAQNLVEDLSNMTFKGQESSLVAWRLLKIYLLALGVKSVNVKLASRGCLLENKFLPQETDCVIARPSFDEGPWGREQLLHDERWSLGVPPAQRADYAYLQHVHYLLKPGGRAALVLPSRTLDTDTVEERSIRKGLVSGGFVECIVLFPSGIFFQSQEESSIWILKANLNVKSSAQQLDADILFIDAKKMGKSGKELLDSPTAIEALVQVYQNWIRDERVTDIRIAASVSIGEVLRNVEISLNPSAYVARRR